MIKQIQTGQIEAANIQGNALDALLVPARTGMSVAARGREEAVFGDCLPQDLEGCTDRRWATSLLSPTSHLHVPAAI